MHFDVDIESEVVSNAATPTGTGSSLLMFARTSTFISRPLLDGVISVCGELIAAKEELELRVLLASFCCVLSYSIPAESKHIVTGEESTLSASSVGEIEFHQPWCP
jgi:hypothetical protein